MLVKEAKNLKRPQVTETSVIAQLIFVLQEQFPWHK